MNVDKLADKLEHTRFEPYGTTGNPDIPIATSVLDYIFRWLRLHFTEVASDAAPRTFPGTPYAATPASTSALSGLTCPDCGSQLEYLERCLVCRDCGYTKCG